ncbi:MAG: hypothetical protein OXC14_09945, partial [Rhodospirillaceae bacterium]|nr:hypothetical protein [Rhodospirillaceae bacterium]
MSDDPQELVISLVDGESPVATSRCFRVSGARKVTTSDILSEDKVAVEIDYARWVGEPYPEPAYLV